MNICVVGCGYVGLPLAALFSDHFSVSGFDIDETKIADLNNGNDPTGEIENFKDLPITFTTDPAVISEANLIIVAVPTPITENKLPDLTLVKAASTLVGENLKKNSMVVYESTVYPGVTEEICLPILEKKSGFKLGDFGLGYSPERVNPGDKHHTIDKIVKVVSAHDEKGLAMLEEVYGKICSAGIHKAPNIRTAEAAKVIENIQRDLNIALVNELALIFDRIGIDTQDVLDAAATKWNFHNYTPGLVGGHCIGVDPYYLTYKAQELGYIPQVILAGRAINEHMPKHVAIRTIQELNKQGHAQGAKVLILGLTFKENCNDTRNSKAKQVIEELRAFGIEPIGYDPYVSSEQARDEFGLQLTNWQDVASIDALVILCPHNEFKKIPREQIRAKFTKMPIIVDVKKMLGTFEGVYYAL